MATNEATVPQLSPSAQATLLRIANRIAQGFFGTIELDVARNGGVRSIRWIQTETGDQVREQVGI